MLLGLIESLILIFVSCCVMSLRVCFDSGCGFVLYIVIERCFLFFLWMLLVLGFYLVLLSSFLVFFGL